MADLTSKMKPDLTCFTCGTLMKIRGESANPSEYLVECAVCGEAYLLPKRKIESRTSWGKS